jgi:hypothetical protein
MPIPHAQDERFGSEPALTAQSLPNEAERIPNKKGVASN